ncbi:MAG: hypothetical protein ABEH43_03160 [Flavobacteriales bacterium]
MKKNNTLMKFNILITFLILASTASAHSTGTYHIHPHIETLLYICIPLSAVVISIFYFRVSKKGDSRKTSN